MRDRRGPERERFDGRGASSAGEFEPAVLLDVVEAAERLVGAGNA